MAIALVVLVFWNFVLAPPQMTAMELIERARVAEQSPLQVLPNASVQRVLQASRRMDGVLQQVVEHEEIWDGVPGLLHRVHARNQIVDELSETIPVPDCRGLSPLSARMMQCLAKNDGAQSRVVTPRLENDGVYQVAIDFRRPLQGSPFSSIWSLRISDWQITSVDFHFFTYPQELSYRLDLLTQFVIDKHRASQTQSEQRPQPAERRSAETIATSGLASNLASAKLSVFSALQSLGLTPDDEILIEQAPDGLRVIALLPDDLRKWQVGQALHTLDGVETRVYSYADAVELSSQTSAQELTASSTPAPSTPTASVRGEGPLLQGLLVEHFGGGESAQAKVAELSQLVLNATQSMGFHSRWLSRIDAAFSDGEREQLSPAERDTLRQIETEVLREIAEAHRQLHLGLRAQLCPALCGDSAPAGGLGATLGPQSGATGDRKLIPKMLLGHMESEFLLLKTLLVDRGYGGKAEELSETGNLDSMTPSGMLRQWLREADAVSARFATIISARGSAQMQANR